MGLLNRALDEIIGLRHTHAFFAPSGRCWHNRSDCQGLNTAGQLTERDPCNFCLISMPPYIVHEHTGNTLLQECRTFFDLHGGRINYMDTIIYDVPNLFT